MLELALKVQRLSKKYHLHHPVDNDKGSTSNDLWALKDVSFEVKKGESVGIFGPNGGGKSTLLKILAGITQPSSGSVELLGRVAGILEIGAGFHPELSGKENIYLNGQILGFNKKEIQANYDEIVAFSGIGKFIAEPVKNYSNGMYLRLAFSIMAHLDFDIYLFDEVMSVGDNKFMAKATKKIEQLINSGKTIIHVSHEFSELNNKDIYILLENGQIKNLDRSRNALYKYVERNIKANAHNLSNGAYETTDFSSNTDNREVKMKRFAFFQDGKYNQEGFRTDKPIQVEIEFEKLQDTGTIDIVLVVQDHQGNPIVLTSAFVKGKLSEAKASGTYLSQCILRENLFYSQLYKISLYFIRNLKDSILVSLESDELERLYREELQKVDIVLKLSDVVFFKPIFHVNDLAIDLSKLNLSGQLLIGNEWRVSKLEEVSSNEG